MVVRSRWSEPTILAPVPPVLNSNASASSTGYPRAPRCPTGATKWCPSQRWLSQRLLGHVLVVPVGHLGAIGYPVLDALAFEFNTGGTGARIVGSDHLDRTTIPRTFLFDDHHTI